MKNPFTIIKDDHAKVKQLFTEYERIKDGDEKTKKEISHSILEELHRHTKMEEKFLYPLLERVLDDENEEYVEEAKAEHTSVKLVMAQLAVLPISSPKFDANMTVLREQVEHHIGEEEDTLLPLAEENLTQNDKEDLAEKLLTFKEDAKKGLAATLGEKIDDFLN